jgi:hypothetical protein
MSHFRMLNLANIATAWSQIGKIICGRILDELTECQCLCLAPIACIRTHITSLIFTWALLTLILLRASISSIICLLNKLAC